MREILSRGKRVDNGEWVVGSYIYAHKWNWDGSAGHLICNIYGTTKTQVIPETVGQFTGLTDKNGKNIFEGDIIQGTIVSAWNKALIRCEVVYNKDGFISVERTRNQHRVHKVKFAKDIEVIGNIHDNPELLGE